MPESNRLQLNPALSFLQALSILNIPDDVEEGNETDTHADATANKKDGGKGKKMNMSFQLKRMLATAFWLGLMPFAPGTFGTLLGVLIHVAVYSFLPLSWHVLALTIALFLVSYANHALTPWAKSHWGKDDPGNFVLDEVAGYLVVPILFHQGDLWQVVFWGFLLFRVYDIIKIPPARQIDRKLHGSWGILLDDLVSATYAVLTMYFLVWLGVQMGWSDWLIRP